MRGARKLPIMSTAGAGFGFFFGRFWTLLARSWLLLLLIGGLYAALIYFEFRWMGVPRDPRTVAHIFTSTGLINLALIVFGLQLWTHYVDIYVGHPARGNLLGLRFGKPEIRLVITYVMFAVMLTLLSFALIAAGGIIVVILLNLPHGSNPLDLEGSVSLLSMPEFWPGHVWAAVGLMSIVGGLYWLQAAGRLAPAFVIAVAEDRVGILRAWRLTSGNGVRILLSAIVMTILTAMLFFALWIVGVVIFFAIVAVTGDHNIVIESTLSYRWYGLAIIVPSAALAVMFQTALYCGFVGAIYRDRVAAGDELRAER